MLGRAVTAFRKSVIKSKSSSTLTVSEGNDEDCAESVVSSISSKSLAASISTKHRKESSTRSTSTSSISFLRRQRRSRSTNREEGEKNQKKNRKIILNRQIINTEIFRQIGAIKIHFNPSLVWEFLKQYRMATKTLFI